MSNLSFNGAVLLCLVIGTTYYFALQALMQRSYRFSFKLIWGLVILALPIVGALSFFIFSPPEDQAQYH